MNIRFDFKKVQIIARRLVTLLAILFLFALIGMLNADSIQNLRQLFTRQLLRYPDKMTSMSCHWISLLSLGQKLKRIP